MRDMKLALIRMLPWVTRYFVVSDAPVDRLEVGLATLIRKKGKLYSYLYLEGAAEHFHGPHDERVPDTDCFWGRWVDFNMRKGKPEVREVDELEAFVMIRQAASPRPARHLGSSDLSRRLP